MTPTSVTRAYVRAAPYFLEDWFKIVFSTVLIGVSTVAKLGQPFPLALLIDCVIPQVRPEKGGDWVHRLFLAAAPSGRVSQIVLLAVITLLLRFVQEAIGLWQGLFNLRIGFNGLLRIRSDLFRKFQALSLGYHRSRPQGDAIYRLISDTNAFQAAFNVVQSIFINIVTLGVMVCIMLGMNWKLALLALSVMPILFWTIKAYGAVLTHSSTQAAKMESDLTSMVQRSVASIGLVQAFGREEDEFARFREGVRGSNRAWMRMHTHNMVYWLIIGMAFGLGGALIFGFGGYLAYRGVLTVGFLWVFLQYMMTQLYEPLNRLSVTGSDLRRGLAGMQRVYEVLDLDPVIRDAPDAMPLPRQPRVLALRHVSFAYRPDSPVLCDVSVAIAPGQMVAFVGRSGVGKSSLLNLLPRFYDPTGGALTLDGHDLRKVKLRDLRRHVALVLQENAILPASVAENIAYGRPDASEAEIRRAAALAGADTFIEALPQQYDTVLDEQGQNLSGGQRQRIAIARALATEAPILVLDEPTSALDPHNEQMITETLRALKGQRTIVLVSHRLSTVYDCDRIYVMDAGRVVEEGTHDELIAAGGLYFSMARHQMKLADPAEEVAEA